MTCILVVEDDPAIRDTIATALAEHVRRHPDATCEAPFARLQLLLDMALHDWRGLTARRLVIRHDLTRP